MDPKQNDLISNETLSEQPDAGLTPAAEEETVSFPEAAEAADGHEEGTAEAERPQEPSDVASAPAPKQMRDDKLYNILDWVRTLAIVIVLGLLITNYVIQRNTVDGSSMYPTLKSGDELFVEKVSRYFGAIHRGDIITVDTHGIDADNPNRVIKRVVGMPGEHVEIKDGSVYINGKLFEEAYLAPDVETFPHDPRYAEVRLADNEYFCLGDNRGGSKDSRSFGPIPADHILGKLLIRFYPFNSFGRP